MKKLFPFALLAALLLLAARGTAQSPTVGAPRGPAVVPFTADQAQKGRALYNAYCASCHGTNLGGGTARALTGRDFRARWNAHSPALPADIVTTSNKIVANINKPLVVTPQEFAELTKVPIQIIYGDNIEKTTPSPLFGVELWRVVTKRAQQFVDLVNKRGGRASILWLPDADLKGNTHFPFSGLNNLAVADLLSKYLAANKLD